MALPPPAQSSLALVFLALAAVRELSWWVQRTAPTAAPAEEAEPLFLEPEPATWVATLLGLWSSFKFGVSCAVLGLVAGLCVGLWLRLRLGAGAEVRIANQTSMTVHGAAVPQHAAGSRASARRGRRGVLESPRARAAVPAVVQG